MLAHLYKIAVRNFVRNKSFAFINVFGLSFGLTTFILIALFVQYELSWDKFNDKYERIYRLQPIAHMADGDQFWSQVGYPVGGAIRDSYPEIEASVVTRPVWGEYLSTSEKLTFKEDEGQYVQESFFDVFTIDFIEGDPKDALAEPYSIVLTESLKDKYFGVGPALGKFIKVNNRYELKVTGVIRDLPENSSFEADYLSPIKLLDLNDTRSKLEDQWDNFTYYTYLLISENASKNLTEAKIRDFLEESKYFEDIPTKYSLFLHPLTSVHLLPDPSERGLLIIVYLYGSVAIFALLIACINFMNMTTAYSVSRAKEVGIKKVVGSTRFALTRQFLFESTFVSLISMTFALFLAEISLPYFNTIVSRQLELSPINNWPFFAFIAGITLLTGLISGIYPAVYLSKFRPVRALKNASSLSNSKSVLRKGLVTFQFAVSASLILSTIGIYNQFTFMKNKELGFEKESVMYAYIEAQNREDWRKLDLIRSRIGQMAEIENITVSSTIPFHGSQGTNISWEGALPEETVNSRYNFIGYDFIKTYGLEIIEGRNFSREVASDTTEACLINETALKTFGWDDPLDKKVEMWGHEYHVIGVVKDFHPFSVFQKIPPFIFRLSDENIDKGQQHSVRMAAGSNFLESKDRVSALYKEFFPDALFDFRYLGHDTDDTIYVIYNGIVKTFLFFSMVTISIAVVGMFGLVAFTTRSRTKEIGIRKVHGASANQVFVLLAKEFVILMIIAVLLSVPVGIGFESIDPAAYKAPTDIWEYLLTAALVFVITLFTVTWHTGRAAKQNPVDSLRYE